MDTAKRKELMNAYKHKVVTGGIYCIECSGNGRKWIKSTVDMEGIKNRYDFAVQMNGSPSPEMGRECAQYGADSFSFTCLEVLEKKETQSDKEFADDIKALYDIYMEKAKQE